MVLEIADDRVHLDAGVLEADRGCRVAQRLFADVERNETAQGTQVGERIQQESGLLRSTGAELDERVGLGELGDLRRAR